MPDRTEQLLRTLVSIVSAVDDYLFAWHFNAAGRCTVAFESRPIGSFLGVEEADPIAALRGRIFEEDLRLLEDWLSAALSGVPEVRETVRAMMPDGYPHLITLHGVCSPDADSMVIEGILKDAGSAERAHDELLAALTEAQNLQVENELLISEAQLKSRTDALTGAFNRRYFMECVTHTLEQAGVVSGGIGFVILDIDKFKSINDTYGHPAGDAVLIEVAARLSAAVRESDVVARFGGEEFALLVRGVVDEEQLQRIGERVRCAISARPIPLPDGADLDVTASAGAALWTPASTFEELLDQADTGLYAAKRGGRNQLRTFSSLTEQELVVEEPEAITLARGLALATSVREASPERHCEEVAEMAADIAASLDLGDAVVMRCRLGGWLHDVGKLGVPDRVLQGRVTDGEDRALLRSHVQLGADIVSSMSSLRISRDAVRHHHERWDGTGYPDALAGEDIPIDARIVAVADAYSAIRAGRHYQAALDHDATCEELRRSAGTHFDPAVVEAVVTMLDRGSEELRDAA